MTMTNNNHHRRRLSVLAVISAAVAGSILFASNNNNNSNGQEYSLRNNLHDTSNHNNDQQQQQQQQHRRQLAAVNLAQFTDPKSVTQRSVDVDGSVVESDATAAYATSQQQQQSSSSIAEVPNEHFTPINHNSRNNCQIVYIMGVEGATHHGFIPILENLASHQVDPQTSKPYAVDSNPASLKAGLFGWFGGKIQKWGFQVTPEIDDDEFVRRVVQESCPDDGRKHVLIEWASFPSGQEDDKRSYRVHRQHEWLTMSPEEIANTEEALSHPTSMNAFYQAYSPYVDIKFVVLHRPFLETIASHRDWDGGPEVHSNIIRGFMLMLRRFLDMHVFDLVTGSRLWNLVCVESIMAKNYESEKDVRVARRHVMEDLANFLGWPVKECDHCFDDWRESTKDPVKILGKKNMGVLVEHMKWLEGVWPPPGEVGVVEQQCGI